jgi:predicted SAM-dependent methyltransferase
MISATSLPVPTEIGTGLWLVIPSRGMHRTEFTIAVLNMAPPINTNMAAYFPIGMLVDEARNVYAQNAVDHGAKYLMFQDEDVLAPPHAVRQMYYRLENNPHIDIVTGVYCAKSKPPFPLVFRGDGVGSYWDWKVGEFFEVTGCGMGLTMIRTSLLKKMTPPWFLTQNFSEKDEGKWVNFRGTEDLYFARRAREEHGTVIYCDASLVCDHIENDGTRWGLPPDCKPLSPLKEDYGDSIILNLGAGDTTDHFPEGKAIKVDLRESTSPDFRADVRSLPFTDNFADIVFSSHTLEHFGRHEVEAVLKEWARVLKPGGEMRLVVPNIEWAAEKILDPKTPDAEWDDIYNVLYGAQTYAENFHYFGFTPRMLTEILEAHGIKNNKITKTYYHIISSGRKVDPVTGEVPPPPKKDEPTDGESAPTDQPGEWIRSAPKG